MEPEVFNHAEKIYELIDTSIKIGLGAIISGVATYLVTKVTHKHEIKRIEKDYEIDIAKEKLKKKFEYLEEAIKGTDLFFKALSDLTQEWNKYENNRVYLKDLDAEEQTEYNKVDEQFIKSKENTFKIARKLKIIGAENILTTIRQIDSIIHPKRAAIKLNESTFIQQPKLAEIYQDVNQLGNIYDKQVKEAFEKLS